MTPQILLLLCLLAVALALFWSERISAEVIGLGLLLALVFTGLLPADQAFAGFGSDTVIMILGLLTLFILPTLYKVFERRSKPAPHPLPDPPSTTEVYPA